MPVERKILAAFASAVLVLVVAAVTYANIRAVRKAHDWVSHTHEVIETLLGIERDAESAETCERSYLLAGGQWPVTTYRLSVERLGRALDRLRPLVADKADQAQRERALEEEVGTAVELFEQAARARAAGGPSAAVRFVSTGVDSVAMGALMTDAATMIDTERALLDARGHQLDHDMSRTVVITAIGGLIAFLLAIAANHGIRIELSGRARRAAELRQTLEERDRALAELETTNHDLDQFAYVASHDLKAPLRGIANLSVWIEEDLGPALSDAAREHIDRLRGRVHRMEELIDGLLAYARAGRTAQRPEIVSVAGLVRDVVELLAVPQGRVAVRLGDLPTLRTERVPLQQVLMNLIGNAVKHNPREGAEVSVDARRVNGVWELSVSDNGPGVAPEYRERIFKIFQKLDSRDKVEGAGIGLAVVQKVVVGRGGRVRVEASPSGGAVFRFTWPPQLPAKVPLERPSAAATPQR